MPDDTNSSDAWQSQSTRTGRHGSATTAASKDERGLPLSEANLLALDARGIDVELMQRLGVRASEMLAGNAIAIPYLENGHIVGRKHRTIAGEKRFIQDTGSKQNLLQHRCPRRRNPRARPARHHRRRVRLLGRPASRTSALAVRARRRTEPTDRKPGRQEIRLHRRRRREARGHQADHPGDRRRRPRPGPSLRSCAPPRPSPLLLRHLSGGAERQALQGPERGGDQLRARCRGRPARPRQADED